MAASSRQGKAKTIGVTPDPDLLEWVSRRMGVGGRWSGPTHFFNWAAKRAREEEEQVLDAIRQGRADLLLELLSGRQIGETPAPKGTKRRD